MKALVLSLIILSILQSSKAASEDGEHCATGSTCAVGSTCYLGLCTPGLNGLPCNTKEDCIATASCNKKEESDPICVRPDRCVSSVDCLLHEGCSVKIGLCIAGTHGMPCSSNEECLPSHECLNSICNQPRQVVGVPSQNLFSCVDSNIKSVPEPNRIELPSWLIGAVAFVLAGFVGQASQWIMKPETLQRRRTIFFLFLAGSILLWTMYFVLAVIDQVSKHRVVSHLDDELQASAECFQPDSVVYDRFRQNEGDFSRQFRISSIASFCEVVASIVLTLAVLWLAWHYLQEYPNHELKVQWKKVIPIAIAATAVGFIGIFVGAKIAIDNVSFFNPFCGIVTVNDKEYVTCALSNSDIELPDVTFSDEAEEVCSAMTQQSIETGNILSADSFPDNFINLVLQFTSSPDVVLEVARYTNISVSFAFMFFVYGGFGNTTALRITVAFIFLKVIFDLLLSLFIVKLVYRTRKVSVLTGIVATLLVICELGLQISGSVWNAAFQLEVQMVEVFIVCGLKVVRNDLSGVLDRSFSWDVGDVLKAGSAFVLAVVGFKELFTS